MSSSSAGQADRYALVSSFYGPGATGGWYLTGLACMVSFGLHPRKRGLDSITVDLIAFLAFPTVAAAHLISQVHSYSRNVLPAPDETVTSATAQNAASVEAALVVTETFLSINNILLLPVITLKCVRRGCLLAVVCVFCFGAECHLYFSPSVTQAIEGDLGRSFLINFGSILMSMMAMLLSVAILALSIIVLFFAMRPTKTPSSPAPTVTLGLNVEQEEDEAAAAAARRKQPEWSFTQSRNALALTRLSMLYFPCSFIAASLPLWFGTFRDLPSQFLPWLRAAACHLAEHLIPRSNIPVKDLDQAVALLAGATVLGFSLYSTAESYYQARLSRTCARPRPR